MQVPPLETHRRDGLFVKYSTRALSPVPVSDTPLKLPGHISSSLKRLERGSAGEEERRVRGAANGSRVGALIESWETAREKGESGQQDIERRSTSHGGSQ
ncbi:hypothetical protein PFLUV_G00069120 [Perca fluviatilis]|uniref:Uncharacterized protein n=1 Tax=Perca fluviatilis TaxID=8168 RepID=A0A6A5F6F4_PERFL|nr:hypothetical protein PFLUV_G00069120 [Perca fluviatilis]